MLNFCKIRAQKPEWIPSYSHDPRITCIRIQNYFPGPPWTLCYKQKLVFLTSSMEAALFSHVFLVVTDTEKMFDFFFYYCYFFKGR